MHHTRRNAFSLVELSIVLVIVGLLVGGILAGQSLIRSSALRGVITDYQKFTQAVGLFQNEFRNLPGDMTNAIDYWGAANSTPATCVTTASSSIATCNGNGDGSIVPSSGSNESFRFWQHLTNAGLIVGTFDGITHGSTNYSATRENAPSGKISNSLWLAWDYGTTTSGTLFDNSYGNSLQFGGALANNGPTASNLRPEEAWNIDTKLDDGKPGLGRVMTPWSGCTTASATTGGASATYALGTTSMQCILMFPNAFVGGN